ncbi:MAG: hypothetical protein KatS3mg081_1872 [Gemmatimonadales bacterium]|nr:MAG: hypothetical protein KatS3mg081_1872 [Gemmatimonadales bacterium]
MNSIAALLLAGAILQDTGPMQAWNDPYVLSLIHRAIARRSAAQADSGLKDFRARAHGFVFFLGQLGEQLTDPPRLIKTDQLVLEVYWKAPGMSKQRIVGWRDRLDLPSDIQYHRDHLGIVMGGFGDRIQLGEGTEVRGVPHPLSPAGPALYDYLLTDSLALDLPHRRVRVYEVTVRPKDLGAPRVAGRLYLDVDYAELVRFSFEFTPSAYLDRTLERITVVLDNGLWDGRFWLPRRQEIEIRRRSDVLDLPARGIIRGRWEIGDYQFNLGLEDELFRGPEIVAAPRQERERFVWPETIDEAVAAELAVERADLQEVRATVSRILERRAAARLPAVQPGVPSISEVVRVNRVEGMAVGAGATLRPGPLEIKGSFSYGAADRRAKGAVRVSWRSESWYAGLLASRQVRDAGDEPQIAPLVNSLLAQEAGIDYGDYFLLDRVEGRLRHAGAGSLDVGVSAGVERAGDLAVAASPVRGTYRENPPLGSDPYLVVRLELVRRGVSVGAGGITLEAEGGSGPGPDYLRLRGTWSASLRPGLGEVVLGGSGGWGSPGLPAHRVFLWGGRGAARCDDVWPRCGGRYGASGGAEWRLRLPFPALQLSPVITTGRQVIVAPFFKAAWFGGVVAGAPWSGTGGVLPVGGVAVEWLHQLLRWEVGMDLREGRLGVTLDINRVLWPIL